MNKSESKYFNTACLMDEALLYLLEKKDFEYITVKEICKKAGVNRSTFYLHYENTSDLLSEANEYINKKFFEVYEAKNIEKLDISKLTKEESVFVTPEYLVPYLDFIKDNKRIFKTIYNNPETFGAKKTFDIMYKELFAPVLEKFEVEEERKEYIFEFYMKGVLAIIIKWVNNDCKNDIDFMVKLIVDCATAPLFKDKR